MVAQKNLLSAELPFPTLPYGAELTSFVILTQNAEVIGEFSKFNRVNIKCRSLFRHDRSHRLLLRSFTSYFFFLHRGKRIRRELNKNFLHSHASYTGAIAQTPPPPPPRPRDSGPFASGFLNVFKFSKLHLYEVLRKLSAIKNSKHTF